MRLPSLAFRHIHIHAAPAARAVDNYPTIDAEPASWVIKEKGTGRVILETYSASVVSKLNTAKYEAVPIKKHLASLSNRPSQDAGLTEWKIFPYATYEKLEVGKNYKLGEKRFTVLEKSLGDGGKNAVGMSNGQPMAKIRWRDAQDADPSSYLGKLVKFKIPSLNGPMKVAGTVKLILPDGRLEVKSQNHGYHKVAISELVE